ncbi:hypothetical protein AAFF_G00275410 [Aldrovandia affinis]|uniref:Uncharacterized protein n=1 Tax=Aldrovandia affinis TaxID=143900 RepID=A0AAD7WTG6_9TELE|nr:hypothetical protein AAFF_G00275410 [Aldrovandia affinis]
MRLRCNSGGIPRHHLGQQWKENSGQGNYVNGRPSPRNFRRNGRVSDESPDPRDAWARVPGKTRRTRAASPVPLAQGRAEIGAAL